MSAAPVVHAASTLPNLNTLVGSIAALLGLITVILGLWNQRRIRKTATDVQSISVNVDGRLSKLIERQAQLLGALHESGTPVPAPPPAPGTLLAGEDGEKLTDIM
jgi:hypothetical protein